MAIVKATEINGAGNYPSTRLRQKERKILEIAEQYSVGDSADWATTDPTTITEALDRLAAAVKDSSTSI